jgi:hypothetical protein
MKKKTDYWKYPKNAPAHPYVEFEKTPLWRTVKKAIADLEKNQDIRLEEFHEYVVGYICKQLAHKKLVSSTALKK